MKILKFILLVMAITVLTLSLAACGNDNGNGNGGETDVLAEMREALQGRWYHSDWLVYEFNADGTGAMIIGDDTDSFRWTLTAEEDLVTGDVTYKLTTTYPDDPQDNVEIIVSLTATSLVTTDEFGTWDFSRTP